MRSEADIKTKRNTLTLSAMAIRRKKPFHEVVNAQGLPQICDDNSNIVRRGVWLFVLCGALAFTAFNINNQIWLYLSVPVNVRVDNVLDKTLPFPSLTICNNNLYLKSSLTTIGMEDIIYGLFQFTDIKDQLSPAKASFDDTPADYSDGHYRLNLSHSIERTVAKCNWESAPCGQDDFIYKETDMGTCFTYNVNGSLRARNSGRAHGLRLLLNVQEEEYTRSRDGYLGTGFMIAVHGPEVTPIMSEMGIAVAPGFQHFVGIGVKRVTAKEGVGGCGKKPLKYLTGNYSRHSCRQECQMDFILSMCNCRDMSNPNKDFAFCKPQEYHECFAPAKKKYLQTDTGCEAGCPEPCSYTRFTTQHSSSPLSRNYITEYTKAKGKTEEYWRKNLVILEMYFSSMIYEHMEKQLGYEILDLFCDIGGALGLMLGASLLTVLEVFDFMFLSVFSAVFEKNKVRRIDIGDNAK
ncbi:acid-sensing ion channel 2-like [Haliotis rufescens]|uniref:acid-sensing ion channel 2-like n=1 Tax=Haliotis rufescens TaxID=6454 RepID=UPI00201F8D8F|nr:acid-sensing ion channel 2-like [Haliotis rufescens]